MNVFTRSIGAKWLPDAPYVLLVDDEEASFLPLVELVRIEGFASVATRSATDALAWKLLGFEPGPKFTLKAVKAAILGHELEGRRQVDPRADFKKEAAKLLARKVGVRGDVHFNEALGARLITVRDLDTLDKPR